LGNAAPLLGDGLPNVRCDLLQAQVIAFGGMPWGLSAKERGFGIHGGHR
jgi:hypothetical protein